ncbi:hypothetical protein N8467_00320, partial [bacterium]|nr:hypothetical protein [bacterium]
MSYDKFKPDDIIVNTIKAHPKQSLFIYDSQVYINKHGNLTGTNGTVTSVPAGYVSLYELNLDRTSNYINASSVEGVSNIGFPDKKSFNSLHGKYHSGNTLTTLPNSLSYPLSSSISRELTSTISVTNVDGNPVTINRKVDALKNVALKYTVQSPHFELSSSFLGRDLTTTTDINIINIPTIFYESTIKKGSVNLKFNQRQFLIGECADIKKNGELIQTGPEGSTGSGSVVGLVFYDEGIIMLTASYDLFSAAIDYTNDGSNDTAKWIYYGIGIEIDGTTNKTTGCNSIVSASFNLDFEGTSYTNTMTLFCHAEKGKYNFSNNPTSIDSSSAGSSIAGFTTSPYTYKQPRL